MIVGTLGRGIVDIHPEAVRYTDATSVMRGSSRRDRTLESDRLWAVLAQQS